MSKGQLKSRALDTANIPKDVVLGVPLLRLVGREELYLGNYRGILEYTDTLIRVQTKIGQIHLRGKHLQVVYYTNDEMKVTGVIDNLEYQQGG
ncbi:MAG: YabP/YqfC family sporulation protein [Faecalimonas sp.]|nr:YabP/YqfC family sporulation protein [Faecalimonas sp.]